MAERICDGCGKAHAWVQPCRVIVPDYPPAEPPPTCLRCGGSISPRYLPHGVCQNCSGTDDHPIHGGEGDR